MVEQHNYDPLTQTCSCGEDFKSDDPGWEFMAGTGPQADARAEKMSRIWHIYHRVELGLGYHYEQVQNPTEPCPACFMAERPIADWEMISGNTRVELCDYSAKEYGHIMLHMFKEPMKEPFLPDCDCCTKAMAEIRAGIESS